MLQAQNNNNHIYNLAAKWQGNVHDYQRKDMEIVKLCVRLYACDGKNQNCKSSDISIYIVTVK